MVKRGLTVFIAGYLKTYTQDYEYFPGASMHSSEFSFFFVASCFITEMIICRIDIKNRYENLPLTNHLLRLLVALYIVSASGYLIYKLISLPQQRYVSPKEWVAVIINVIIIFILARQLLRLNNRKFILVTD